MVILLEGNASSNAHMLTKIDDLLCLSGIGHLIRSRHFSYRQKLQTLNLNLLYPFHVRMV